MKAFVLGVLLLIFSASAAAAQSVDQGPVECRDFVFPFNVICLSRQAGYQPVKWCAEVIGQKSIKPAGQQCESEIEPQRDRAVAMEPREPPKECEHEYKDKKGGGYDKSTSTEAHAR